MIKLIALSFRANLLEEIPLKATERENGTGEDTSRKKYISA